MYTTVQLTEHSALKDNLFDLYNKTNTIIDSVPKDEYKTIMKIKYSIEWYAKMLNYNIVSSERKCNLNLKKGDVFEIDWGTNVNCEFSQRHYGVVLTDSNERNPLVLVCPLKTNRNGPNLKSDLNIGHIDGLNEHGTLAIVNQIRSIDKFRIFTKQVIKYNMHDYMNVKMPIKLVDEIINAYHHLIDGEPFSQIY